MYTLITGASRGIGKALAYEFAEKGYNLVLICKNNIDILDSISKELGAFGVKCHTFKCDISSFEEVDSLWKTLHSLNIHIDVLINNAAYSYVGLLQDMTIEAWNATINTNLSSAFYMCKNAIPSMVHKKSGKIINISSVWGSFGASMEVAYSASKGGLNTFTKALAKELAPSNIQVNAVSFGVIDTDMNSHLTFDDREALRNEIPACRFASPKEAARLVYNIVNSGDYLTGANITMDGGWY